MNIDLTVEGLRREAIQLAMATHGGIRYWEALELPWDEYEAMLAEVKRITERGAGNAAD